MTSRDGTSITFDRAGGGPAVVLVGGGLDEGAENAPLMPQLAEHFTVYNYARRGRGGSGDTPPYAVARELEDLAAIIADAGGTAHLFGASSGGALALEAAAAGLPVGRVAVYEVPYSTDDHVVAAFREYVRQLHRVLAEGRRGAAVELFMRLAGAGEDDIAAARTAPVWPGLEALAPTLAHDAACLGDGSPPLDRLATITQPVLVATGGLPDPHTGALGPGFFDAAADAIAAAVPNAERRVVDGQTHVTDPVVLAPVLTAFFTGRSG
ncbi:alpha/beta hydrolase [Dactylosporangium fulvum]